MPTDLTPSGGSPNAKQIGDAVEWTFTFTTSAGGAATVAAADVTVTVEKPDYTTATYTGVQLTVTSGVVTLESELDQAGVWRAYVEHDDGTTMEADGGFVWVRGKGVGPTS